MKNTISFFLFAAFLTASLNLNGATCTGAANCKACRSCKSCKHCAKEGGTCGVCKPAKSNPDKK